MTDIYKASDCNISVLGIALEQESIEFIKISPPDPVYTCIPPRDLCQIHLTQDQIRDLKVRPGDSFVEWVSFKDPDGRVFESCWAQIHVDGVDDNGLREALIRRVRHGATRVQVIRLAKFMGVPRHEVTEDVKGAVVRRL